MQVSFWWITSTTFCEENNQGSVRFNVAQLEKLFLRSEFFISKSYELWFFLQWHIYDRVEYFYCNCILFDFIRSFWRKFWDFMLKHRFWRVVNSDCIVISIFWFVILIHVFVTFFSFLLNDYTMFNSYGLWERFIKGGKEWRRNSSLI